LNVEKLKTVRDNVGLPFIRALSNWGKRFFSR